MSVNNSVLYKIVFFDKFIYSFVEKNLLPDDTGTHISESTETSN